MQAQDLNVTCTYVGVKVGTDEVDPDKVVSSKAVLQFQWVLRTENWEWVVPVTVPKQNLHHGLPLPQCVVTKQRLKDVAEDAGKRNSMEGVEVVCRYEGAAAANGCIKVNESLLVTDVANSFGE